MLSRTRYCWYMNSCKRQDCSYAHREEVKRLPTIAPYVTTSTTNTSPTTFVPNNNKNNNDNVFALNSVLVNPSSSTTTRNLSQKQTNFFNSEQSICSEIDLDGHDDEQSGNFDALNGYGVPFPEISMNNVQWGFSYNQQPDFSWVKVLVEDDHQPVGLVRESSLEEERLGEVNCVDSLFRVTSRGDSLKV
ncbi:hypothetical protein FNV43_RR10252 [Rhamnella rubrinervis]|uniref:Uncharacterized protein n=1 Tax=Rhamnella rubrinervis TaxID=2594499 RepID=A0A8K0HCA8_9ROSA|nr:hypothetical protein FNV43_RR10252 [Rhamnella rubrinervis]